MNSLIQAYEQNRVNDSLDPQHHYDPNDPHARDTVGEDNGRLEGYSTAALRNVVYADYKSDKDAAEDIAKNKTLALNVASGLIGTGLGATGPVGGVAAGGLSAVTAVIADGIEPATVDIPHVPDVNVVAGNPSGTADDEGIQLTTRAQFLNAMLARDAHVADQYADLGIIDPHTHRVDLSTMDPAQMTKLNNELEKRMPASVSQEVDDMTRKRGELSQSYGLTIPDQFKGR